MTDFKEPVNALKPGVREVTGLNEFKFHE
jgi:hypothetical protein